jgi:ABC-type uncharacterized transport system auxiliary subunit
MQNSHLFSGVMRTTSRAKVSLFMESDIIKFQHSINKGGVDVLLRVTLLEYPSRKIIKNKIFKYQQPVSIASAKEAVNSFNLILNKLDQDLFTWLANP